MSTFVRSVNRWRILVLAASLLVPEALYCATPPAPQAPTVVMGDRARRDIRLADDVPDISGVWLPASSNRTIRPLDGSATPFLPWAREFFENRLAAEAAGQPLFDPNANCLPSGVPRVLPTPYPLDIVQIPDKIIIGIEVMHSFRIIHMDGKPAPADYKASYLGYSVGHWEGDVLVIETTGLNGYTQTDEEGRPKSNKMRVIERIVKRAPNVLENTFTIFDPVTYTRPWTARAQYTWAPSTRFEEYVCEENNRNKTDSSGKLRLK